MAANKVDYSSNFDRVPFETVLANTPVNSAIVFFFIPFKLVSQKRVTVKKTVVFPKMGHNEMFG